MFSSKINKNLIYEILDDEKDYNGDKKKLYKKNNALNEKLNKQKNKIDIIYNVNSSLWDEIKKFSNEYEFIYTNSFDNFKNVSNIYPISRSYFKLWEILHDFRLNGDELINYITKKEEDKNNEYITCHLAEGPGGFIECINKYILKYITDDFSNIKIYGSTLISNNTSIPKWKIKKNVRNNYNIILNNSVDENGDLYCINQVELLINKIGNNNCNFITADGGFDFSSNYNNQEKNFMNLFISEIYIILNLLKLGGNGLIKIYDIYSKNSIKVLYILSLFFEKIFITKPYTSRPANSEKYILCYRFSKNDNYYFYLNILKNIIITKNLELLNNNNIVIPYQFLYKIFIYNKWYTERQINYINKTIDYIDQFKNLNQEENNSSIINNKNNNKNDIEFFNDMYDINKKVCINWCKKYNII